MHDYIERVLSHLGDKRNSKKIEYELFDHLDEHQRFFEGIGYDELQAIEKAEEKMGDADILGEQLNAMKKHYYIFDYIIMTLAPILAYIFYRSTALSDEITGMLSSLQPLLQVPCFYGTIVGFIGIVIGLLYIVRGLKRKNILFATYGYLFSSIMLLFAPKEWLDGINKEYFKLFFNTSYSQSSGIIGVYLTPRQIALLVTFLVVFTAFYVIVLANIIKTKKLKNTRRDLSLGRVVSTLIIALSLAFVILGSIITVELYSLYEKITEQAKTELVEINDYIIDNADLLVDMSYDDAVEFFKNKYKESSNEENGKYGAYTFEGDYTLLQCIDYDSLMIETESCYVNPFCIYTHESYFGSDLYNLENSDSITKSTSIDDMSRLCMLDLQNDEISFKYSYQDDMTVFLYDRSKEDFELLYSTDLEFSKLSDLTKEQRIMLEREFSSDYVFYGLDVEYYFTPNPDDLGESYENLKKNWSIKDSTHLEDCAKILDVGYNEELNLYSITSFSFRYYYTLRSGLYDQIGYTDLTPISNCIVRFNDTEAEILYENTDQSIINNYKDDYIDIETDEGKKEIESLIVQDVKDKYN